MLLMPKQKVPLTVVDNLGQTGMEKVFHESGLNPLIGTNTSSSSALHIAAAAGNTAVVLLILKRSTQGDSLTTIQDMLGQTALFAAASGGHVETMSALVDAGADLHARDLQQRTVLHVAAATSQTSSADAILFLCAHGADVHALDAKLSTALHGASFNGAAGKRDKALQFASQFISFHGLHVTFILQKMLSL